MEFFDLNAQHQILKHKIDAGISRVLKHKKFILGPEIEELETKLKTYLGVDSCISVANGTDAIQVALMAIGVKPGDEVITPCFSYISAAEVIALLGAKPVFVDISDMGFNIDDKKIEEKITSRTKCIIPVNLFGQCANFNEINRVAAKYNIPVIEDAAQSFGAIYQGRKSGTLGTVGCTSFFPTKPLGCYGDGGAVFTNDNNLGEIIRQIARHGQKKKYLHARQGVNSRLDSIQGAVLLEKLKIFEDEIKKRNEVADRYSRLLKKHGFKGIPEILPDRRNVWAQYSVCASNRDELKTKLSQVGIPTAIHYPLPLNKQPALQGAELEFDVADKVAKEVISLPMSPYLKINDQDFIVENFLKFAVFEQSHSKS